MAKKTNKSEENYNIKPRKWWFRAIKKITKIRYKKVDFVYLGEELSHGGVVLSNHEGTDAPMSFEIYSKKPIRFWGAYQMNSGLKKLYDYQTKVYYHEKKHWNLFGARMFCLLASPLTNLFYRGLDLISTYPDARFRTTIKESIEAIKDGYNIVVCPEKSDEGYKVTLDGFHEGILLFAEKAYKEGIDLPLFVSYFNKKNRVYLFDVPVKYSELKASGLTREEMAERLCARCNELGQMTYDGSYKNDNKQEESEAV